MCPGNPKGSSSPGLYQKQQDIEGDSAPLLVWGEIPPGLLHPALGPPKHEDKQGSALRAGDRLSFGVIQDGEERTQARS